MNETLVTVVGNVATPIRYRDTSSGIPAASFRLASTVRRWDREQGCWCDVGTSFYTVWAWRNLAVNIAGSVSRGDPLVVHGRMRVNEWERDGQRHTVVEIDAAAVGHDLTRGTSAFRRVTRARPELTAPQQPWEKGQERAGAQAVAGSAAAGSDIAGCPVGPSADPISANSG